MRIQSLEGLHGVGQIGLRRLQKEVIMVVHQTVSKKPKVKLADGFAQQMEERSTVALVKHDRTFLHATVEHVVVRAGKLDSSRSRHNV